MIETSRRSFISGLISFVAAPAIVKATNLMPVKALVDTTGIYTDFSNDIDATRNLITLPEYAKRIGSLNEFRYAFIQQWLDSSDLIMSVAQPDLM